MLKSEVKIPGYYWLKHTSGHTIVHILNETVSNYGRRDVTHYTAINIKTGARITIKSAAKLRRVATVDDIQKFDGGKYLAAK